LGTGRWLWLIENDAHPRDIQWQSDPDRDVFVGSHDGYRRLPEPVDHTRRITFNKRSRWFRIDDTLTGLGEHFVELFFHPGVPFTIEADAVRLTAPGGDAWLLPPRGTISREEAGWISEGYGLRRPAGVLVYAVRAPVPLQLRTDLVLVPHGTPVEVARSLVERG
jgi:uncharacterized heparinase superfamily protein